jgi:hypothetical protein
MEMLQTFAEITSIFFFYIFVKTCSKLDQSNAMRISIEFPSANLETCGF